MTGHDGWMTFGGGYMWILWIVLLLIVIWALRGTLGGDKESPESALEILKKRYAKGEIDEEEYERRKSELQR